MPPKNKDLFISDVVDISNFKYDEFNLIHSGCGSGKSQFVERELLKHLNGVQPHEVIYITSRSIIVDQQTSGERAENSSVTKFDSKDINTIRRWNDEEFTFNTLDCGIKTMTYDKLIYILLYCNNPDTETLGEIKVVIFDECHAIFSDFFIQDINIIKVWIRDTLYRKQKLFIGMTATPSILNYYHKQWGVRINMVLDKPIYKYKANNLYVLRFDLISTVLTSSLYSQFNDGKTLIMCQSIKDCYKIQKKIPNSAVLISRSNKEFTPEMKTIRDYIVAHQTLPENVVFNKKEFPLQVLITTSTFREGINLNDGCGVKNIICCMPDELHLTQFVGRCRFNVENLLVVEEYFPRSRYTKEYLENCKKDFDEFIQNKNSRKWFDSIKHILSDDCKKPIRLLLDDNSFRKYIVENWLNKCIIEEADRKAIAKAAKSCKIIKQKTPITFAKALNYIKNELGFEVQEGRTTINGYKHTYKLILSPTTAKSNIIVVAGKVIPKEEDS